MKKPASTNVITRMVVVSVVLAISLVIIGLLGIAVGSSDWSLQEVMMAIVSAKGCNPALHSIVWDIRLPRVVAASLVGASLSAGGLVFQALLRNPLAEPYILGISGGAAIGAIVGIIAGLSQFPGVSAASFAGSAASLLIIIVLASGNTILKNESLLLSGVMINAFCSAIIMFLITIANDSRLHSIIFWLMGDMSMVGMKQSLALAAMVLPCFVLIFFYSNTMNLILLGKDMARSMGVNVQAATFVLLIVTSFMVSATVSQCGLLGFVGLVIPHFFRLLVGSDHRVLIPACLLGGASYLVLCDLLARAVPAQGELPVGVITAMIGAPLFIYLLKRSSR